MKRAGGPSDDGPATKRPRAAAGGASSTLDSLLDGITERARIEAILLIRSPRSIDSLRTEYSEEIKRILLEVATEATHDNPDGSLQREVELRFGLFTGTKGRTFQAEVTEQEFLDVKEFLNGRDDFDSYDSSTMEHHFPSSSVGESNDLKKTLLRCIADENGEIVESQLKVKETKEIAVPNKQQNLNNALRARQKDRTTYIPLQDEPSWQIEMTKVTTSFPRVGNVHGRIDDGAAGNKTTFELEIEFISSCFERFRSDPAFLANSVDTMFSTLIDIMRTIAPDLEPAQKSDSVSISQRYPELALQQFTDKLVRGKLIGRLKTAMGINQEGSDDFPGSMPVSFHRRNFNHVVSQDYYVSEKTDGVRFLLFVGPEGAFLIDRKLAFARLGASRALQKLFSNDGLDSIIDGELIRHKGTREPTFLVFDAVQINGVNFRTEPLSQRLNHISRLVVKPYRDDAAQGVTFPFVMIGKSFWPKKNIRELLANIQQDATSGHRYYHEREGKRFHATDGLIFTPNTAYMLRTAPTLFKWKYRDLVSIDFRVCATNSSLEKFSLTTLLEEGQECIMFYTELTESDKARLLADCNAHRAPLYPASPKNPIIECTYDTTLAQWRYHSFRPDKHIPNFIMIVGETLLSLVENITTEEIVHLLAPRARPSAALVPGQPPQ